jgi:inorganic pyrophosphatase
LQDETTDWKVIVIDINDPLAALVNSVEDLEQYRPGLAQSMHDWFIYYKVLRGKGLNTIVGGAYVNAAEMQDYVAESHEYWRKLLTGETKKKKINFNQTTHPEWCKSYVPADSTVDLFEIPAEEILAPAERPEKYDRWYYLNAEFSPINVPGEVIDID